jgi:alpha-galactosidase
MSSWVTDEPDQLDPAPASLEFRFVVAMAGVLGIGVDLLAWPPDLRARARELVALYREIRPVVHAGEVTWHGTPADPACAVQYATEDRIVLLAWARPGAAPFRVPLAPARRVVHPGTASPALQHGGGRRFRVLGSGELVEGEVVVPFRLAPDCDVVILDRVPDA